MQATTADGERARLLLVHAHPDDESSQNGATIAAYTAAGAEVTLITCTRGELGEIVAPDLAGLRDHDPDGLGTHRETEMAAAAKILGLTAQHWLGGAGRWRDSGMAGTPDNDDPRAFARADLDTAVAELVSLVRAARPHVIITYDENGGYGHPDHIQAHRVTMAALAPAAEPTHSPDRGAPWTVPKVYAGVLPQRVLERFAENMDPRPAPEDMPRGYLDPEIDAVVVAPEQLDTKLAALAAHRSQVDLTDGFFAGVVADPEFASEHYVLLHGRRGPGSGEHGWESDLVAGIGTPVPPG